MLSYPNRNNSVAHRTYLATSLSAASLNFDLDWNASMLCTICGMIVKLAAVSPVVQLCANACSTVYLRACNKKMIVVDDNNIA